MTQKHSLPSPAHRPPAPLTYTAHQRLLPPPTCTTPPTTCTTHYYCPPALLTCTTHHRPPPAPPACTTHHLHHSPPLTTCTTHHLHHPPPAPPTTCTTHHHSPPAPPACTTHLHYSVHLNYCQSSVCQPLAVQYSAHIHILSISSCFCWVTTCMLSCVIVCFFLSATYTLLSCFPARVW